MVKQFIFCILCLHLLFFYGCKKEARQTDIYVAGKIWSGTGGHYKARYWKNGVPLDLTDGITNDAYVRSIYVKGSDVYAAGGEQKGNNYVATLWKNGVSSQLTDGTYDIEVYSLFVADNDVYIAGSEYYPGSAPSLVAKYWKNGKEVALSNRTSSAQIYAITVSGNDVYAAGYEDQIAKYWKNGVGHALTDGLNPAHTSSIAVSGGDVYVTCTEFIGGRCVLSYFKNDVKYTLGNYTNAEASVISVVNNNVYVGGSTQEWPDIGYKVTYWINGNAINVTNHDEDYWNFSMFIDREDIYLAGVNKNHSITEATYWKNGIKQLLGDASQSATALSVFVTH